MLSQRYRVLSLIQTVAIFISALSVFDMGYSGTVERGIWFNHVLFHLNELPEFAKESPFWGEFQFWGYCFAIVAICQILKAFPLEAWDPRKFSRFSGIGAACVLVLTTIGAIIAGGSDYNNTTETLSSLVDYGWLPTVLMSWGQMIGALLAVPYFLYLGVTRRPQVFAFLASAFGSFSCIMLFVNGLLLPTDEPWNHGSFAYAFFITMAIAIGLFAFTFAKGSPIEQTLCISGWIICPMIFLLIIFAPESWIAIAQKVVVVSYLLWLIGLGWTTFGREIIEPKESELKSQLS
ncbi:MAG: hypothetical protein ACE5OZ_22220 [Candidatus Heimdallarchaeota archaeon]